MATDSKLYSVTIAHTFQSNGEAKTKFRQVAVGFSNRQGGLGFRLPAGMSLSSDAEIVIFPIEKDEE